MLESYKLFWTNYFNFRGRTPRRGFWQAVLGHVIVYLALLFISLIAFANLWFGFGVAISVIMSLYRIAIVIPNLALIVRRFHDIGKKWYWLALYLWPFIIIPLFVIIAFFGAMGGILADSVSDVYGYYGYYSSGIEAVAGMKLTGNIIAFSVIILITYLFTRIALIVYMSTSTKPNAIGETTHIYDGRGAGYGNYPDGALTGLGGVFAGANFPFEEGEELTIGRDAAISHVVIDVGGEKISRRHCTVSFDPYDNAYVVTDLSSNGTYLNSGTRLHQGIPTKLPRGTVIYLANQNNTFKLD